MEEKSKEEIVFKTYCNNRFGFCIEYPYKILYPQGEPDNGSGQIFKSKTADNIMTVYFDWRGEIGSSDLKMLQTAYDEDSWGTNPKTPKKVITYKNISEKYYVVSGFNNGKIFYQKTILFENQMITCLIEYNENESEIYDKVCERIFESF